MDWTQGFCASVMCIRYCTLTYCNVMLAVKEPGPYHSCRVGNQSFHPIFMDANGSNGWKWEGGRDTKCRYIQMRSA